MTQDNNLQEDRRSEARVAPSWQVVIELDDGRLISAAMGDLSVKAFRIELVEGLDLWTRVQFPITEDTNEFWGGRPVEGEATISLIYEKGAVFEFQHFNGDGLDRLCDALLQYIGGSAEQS